MDIEVRHNIIAIRKQNYNFWIFLVFRRLVSSFPSPLLPLLSFLVTEHRTLEMLTLTPIHWIWLLPQVNYFIMYSCLCLYIHVHMCVETCGGHKEHQIPWRWVYKQLWAAWCGAGKGTPVLWKNNKNLISEALRVILITEFSQWEWLHFYFSGWDLKNGKAEYPEWKIDDFLHC